MSEQNENARRWIPALVLAIVVMIVMAVISQVYGAWIRDLQRRVAQLEMKR